MITTVRFDEKHERILNEITSLLHKKKSDVIREALDYYALHVFDEKRNRMQKAVEKVKKADREEMKVWESAIDDGLEG